jgi:MFS superfamily sulfate permease-like transporter
MPDKNKIPLSGFAGLKQNLVKDVSAGFLVFLIALPLCLGISMASGFPPVAGIYTAIIGGLVVSFFGGSNLAIKGPAAGLIVIALGAVEELGGYQFAIATIVIAGAIQIILGILKSGVLGDFFPSAAVQGMLAAIGILIFSKQIHVLLGVEPIAQSPMGLLAEIPASLLRANPLIAVIGVTSLVLLFTFFFAKGPVFKKIPAPLIVLLVSIPMGLFFGLGQEQTYAFFGNEYQIGPSFLISLPENLFAAITFPDFSKAFSLVSLKYVFLFAVVGSLESLLSGKAVDLIDPYKRKSNLNRDLLGIGFGNALAGMIGGLPMISEIVRSSANTNSGARTWWSNFFHGLFLLIFVAFFPRLIETIPLTALAAMLIFTGYKLASPAAFHKIFKVGKEQLAIFIITIIVTVAVDLLAGIFAGIFCEIVYHLWNGLKLKDLFKPVITVYEKNGIYIIDVSHSAVFTNYIAMKNMLDRLPRNGHIVVDFTNSRLVDHSVMSHLSGYKKEYEEDGGIFELKGLDNLKSQSGHELSTRRKV